MSLNKTTKEKIRLYLLEHIERKDRDYVSKTVSAFDVSRTTVYNCLKSLEQEKIIVRNPDEEKVKYSINSALSGFAYDTSAKLEEDRIYKKDIHSLLENLPENVQQIWRYVFTEMMNNAIEHAEASEIKCDIKQSYLSTIILIEDNGVGIFKKIQAFFAQQGDEITLDEAVDALFPGKLTTAASNHSGEGIFFSSRAVDKFTIFSDGKFFSHDDFKDIRFDGDLHNYKNGTIVQMTLSNTSKKQLKDIFSMFANPERGFFKTQIPIAHMFTSGYPVSRSEARRLAAYIRPFEEVTLDFKNVPNVGQAFTHEMFCVFQAANPHVVINTINENEDVNNMICRVKNTK